MTELRSLALSCLPPGVRLRTAREEGLYYVEPCPDPAPLLDAGYGVQPRGAGVLLTLTPKLLLLLEAAVLPPEKMDDLYGALLRLKDRALCAGEITLLEEAIRGMGPGARRRDDLIKRLRQAAAVALRTGEGGSLLALTYQIARRYTP